MLSLIQLYVADGCIVFMKKNYIKQRILKKKEFNYNKNMFAIIKKLSVYGSSFKKCIITTKAKRSIVFLYCYQRYFMSNLYKIQFD